MLCHFDCDSLWAFHLTFSVPRSLKIRSHTHRLGMFGAILISKPADRVCYIMIILFHSSIVKVNAPESKIYPNYIFCSLFTLLHSYCIADTATKETLTSRRLYVFGQDKYQFDFFLLIK